MAQSVHYISIIIYTTFRVVYLCSGGIETTSYTVHAGRFKTRLNSVLSEEIVASNPSAAQTNAQNITIAKASGKGSFESERFSSMIMKGKVTIQGTIVAMKEITGNTIILILIAAVITIILPYYKNETT